MTWVPGLPVLTEQDIAEWREWRRVRKRDAQQWRRARYPRIDFYPDELACEVIGSESGPFVGGTYSSVINRIVAEWAEQNGVLPPEQTKAG